MSSGTDKLSQGLGLYGRYGGGSRRPEPGGCVGGAIAGGRLAHDGAQGRHIGVLDAAAEFGRAFPMMMTAAGTIKAARVLVMGVGVAGLQAIATARRLGAVVAASDVRAAGAHGYVQKSQAGRDLIVAIDALLGGGTFFGGTRGKKAPEGDIPPGISFCWALCCNWMKPKPTS